MARVWRLIVWNVAPRHSGLMARLKMSPAKDKPTTFWREYPNREQVTAAIDALAAAGLHGIAKLAEASPQKPRFRKAPRVASDRSGFGGALNATPIKGSWRRKPRRA